MCAHTCNEKGLTEQHHIQYHVGIILAKRHLWRDTVQVHRNS